MSLNLKTNILTYSKSVEASCSGYSKSTFDTINNILINNKLSSYHEPEDFSDIEPWNCSSIDYDHIYALRRFAAHVWATGNIPDAAFSPYMEDDVYLDQYSQQYFRLFSAPSIIDRILGRKKEQSDFKFSHLIIHSDSEGLYLPVYFEKVILINDKSIPGGMLGSSFKLKAECEELATYLNLNLNTDKTQISSKYEFESLCCLSLHQGATNSVQQKSALVLCD